MAFHKYQVTFAEDGEIEHVIQLPDDPNPRKRTITVIEETVNKAKQRAAELYSLAT